MAREINSFLLPGPSFLKEASTHPDCWTMGWWQCCGKSHPLPGYGISSPAHIPSVVGQGGYPQNGIALHWLQEGPNKLNHPHFHHLNGFPISWWLDLHTFNIIYIYTYGVYMGLPYYYYQSLKKKNCRFRRKKSDGFPPRLKGLKWQGPVLQRTEVSCCSVAWQHHCRDMNVSDIHGVRCSCTVM